MRFPAGWVGAVVGLGLGSGCAASAPRPSPASPAGFTRGRAEASAGCAAAATGPVTAPAPPTATFPATAGARTTSDETGVAVAVGADPDETDAAIEATLRTARGWYLLRGSRVRLVSNAPRLLADACLARAESALTDLQERWPNPSGPGRPIVRLCATRDVFALYGGHASELARYDAAHDEFLAAPRDARGDRSSPAAQNCLAAVVALLACRHLDALGVPWSVLGPEWLPPGMAPAPLGSAGR